MGSEMCIRDSWQTFLVSPHEPLIVASSPKFELIPIRSLVKPYAWTLSTTTLRGDFASLLVQSPQLRYSFPALTTVKSLIVTVPAPLCWTTLSLASCAPPPMMVASPVPRTEMASSQTSRNQTLVSVQDPN